MRYFDIAFMIIVFGELISTKVSMKNKFNNDIKRYVYYRYTWQKPVAYITLVFLLGYYCYRFYLVVMLRAEYTTTQTSMFVGVLLWLNLHFLYLKGIYYNKKQLYVRYKIINYADFVRSTRFYNDVENYYVFDISCDIKNKKNSQLTERFELNFKIKNEKNAYELLSYIPFKE